MKKLILFLMMCSFLFISSCSENESIQSPDEIEGMKLKEPELMVLGNAAVNLNINEPLKSRVKFEMSELKVSLYSLEYFTNGEEGKMGNTIFFMDVGNKQLGGDFVPELALDGTPDVSYYIDNSRPTAEIDINNSNEAMDRAMNTWNRITCSSLGIFEIPFDPESEVGFIAILLQDLGLTDLDIGGSYNYFADVVHAGWLPKEIFNLFTEEGDGGEFILAGTFTLIFTDDEGNPVDIDRNGKFDVAWREIYYNDGFEWNDGSTFDVETVALHEAGHGLSQGHFGMAFLSGGNNRLHFSPRAVMNAAYTGIQTEITRTDEAGHCSNWASWPQN